MARKGGSRGSRIKRSATSGLSDEVGALRDALGKTEAELDKMRDAAKKSGDVFGKLASSAQGFLLSPLMNNIGQVAGNVSNLATSFLGPSAQSLFGSPVAAIRGAANTLSAGVAANDELGGLAAQFAEAGAPMSKADMAKIAPRLYARAKRAEDARSAAADVMKDMVDDKVSDSPGLQRAMGEHGVGAMKWYLPSTWVYGDTYQKDNNKELRGGPGRTR